MRSLRVFGLGLAIFALNSALAPGFGRGFPLVVAEGDTLASLAQKLYGRVENEKILVSSNGLDAGGGIAIVPGLRLEIPAVQYRRVSSGDTWSNLALKLLGGRHRAAVLAYANDSKPWLPPTVGAEVLIPYNLRIVGVGGETLPGLASRFLGSQKRAWMLRLYNRMEGIVLQRGQVVLIPLTELSLTEEGRHRAREATTSQLAESGGQERRHQQWVAQQIPELLAHMRSARYVEAIATGLGFLGGATLSALQVSVIQRQLTEAYVALGSVGRAQRACQAWRNAAPDARIDLHSLGPKILGACRGTSH